MQPFRFAQILKARTWQRLQRIHDLPGYSCWKDWF